MDNLNSFAVLNGVNVNDKLEKKGQFSYLSWPWAHQQMALADPEFTWQVVDFPTPDGLVVPYLRTGCGYFVRVRITHGGITREFTHPILDNTNRPIAEPNAFEVNTSIMRAFVKCCALFGLGLYVYAGEDLPAVEPDWKLLDAVANTVEAALTRQDDYTILETWQGLTEEQQRDFWGNLKRWWPGAITNQKTAIREALNRARAAAGEPASTDQAAEGVSHG